MRQKARAPVMTMLLLAVIMIVFVIEIFNDSIIDAYSFVPALAFKEPWRFVTSIFLHGSISHIFLNMVFFIMFGNSLEGRVGHARFLLVFFAAGIIGNIGYALTSSDSLVPAIGASGAIYGVMGTAAILMPLSIIYPGAPVPLIAMAVIWGITEVGGLFVPSNIAHGSHIGGLFFGAAYGAYLRKTGAG